MAHLPTCGRECRGEPACSETWHNARNLAEARTLGAILPCYWTTDQRGRVIDLTGMSASDVDEIIAVSRMMNGVR
ncbi:MAG TPA: hypothetical protein VLN57_21040 [Xanthobacteraceae bacterium]|nr:hypothetical protein [Xanthobacteraceae bacterium]